MRTRIAVWSFAGFLAAGFWGFYFANADKSKPIGPLVDALARLTQPIAAVVASNVYSPVGLRSFLWMNAATYALIGLIVEALRRKMNHAN
ncbi:MAG TPA: hypothetical protein VGG72_02400 [Bryobacteraceae bacterium]|jgi:hypothetical protein